MFFGNFHYLQVQGVAIGTCAPSYINLYMGESERSFLLSETSKYIDHILTWFCYIGDIFLIWDGPVKLLHECLTVFIVNTFHFKFTMTYDMSKITLLECTPNDMLVSNLFGKLTAGNTILRADRLHSREFIKFIPFIVSICTEDLIVKLRTNFERRHLLRKVPCTLA